MPGLIGTLTANPKEIIMCEITPIREDVEINAGQKVDRDALNRAIATQQMHLMYAMGITRLACDAANKIAENLGCDHPSSKAATDVWTALRGAHQLLARVVDHMEDCGTLLAMEEELTHGNY
jgi:predicted RecB family endonuclease